MANLTKRERFTMLWLVVFILLLGGCLVVIEQDRHCWENPRSIDRHVIGVGYGSCGKNCQFFTVHTYDDNGKREPFRKCTQAVRDHVYQTMPGSRYRLWKAGGSWIHPEEIVVALEPID